MYAVPFRTISLLLLLSVLLLSCSGFDETIEKTPEVYFIFPTMESEIYDSVEISIGVNYYAKIQKVELYAGGVFQKTWINPPYKYMWNVRKIMPGSTKDIDAKAYASDGKIGYKTLYVTINQLHQPGTLLAFDGGNSCVMLSWEDKSLLDDGYLIERKTEEHDFIAAGTAGQGFNTFTDTSPEKNVINEYRVIMMKNGYNVGSSKSNSIKYYNPSAIMTHSYQINGATADLRWVLYDTRVYDLCRKATAFVSVNRAKFSSDCNSFVSADPGGKTLKRINLVTRAQNVTEQIHNSPIVDYALDAAGKRLASFDSDKVIVWSAAEMSAEKSVELKVKKVKFINNDTRIALFDSGGKKIYIYDVSSRLIIDAIIIPENDPVEIIDITADGLAYYADDAGKKVIKLMNRNGVSVLAQIKYASENPFLLSNTGKYVLFRTGNTGEGKLMSFDFSQTISTFNGLSTTAGFSTDDTFIFSGKEIMFLEGKWVGI